MNVYLNEVTGIADAIVSMFMSRRSWTREKELEIRNLCDRVLTRHGKIKKDITQQDKKEFNDYLNKVTKWGKNHITMLRYIDFSITVEGLHRAGQDDWDAHAKRFDNRIIRSSTRLATFDNEISDFYSDKILPTDLALNYLGIKLDDTIEVNGEKYIKRVNGYIKEGYEDNPDIRRGLYMLSIPSNFIFKVNLTEWSHVYKERNEKGRANPEVQQCCESIAEQVENFIPFFNRSLFMEIKN